MPVINGWAKYENETVGVRFYYPDTGLRIEDTNEIVLPLAVGGKERQFSVENFARSDEQFAGGCLKGGETKTTEVGGETFCLTVIDGAALGSTYRTYAYALRVEDEYLLVRFVIRFPTTVSTYEQCDSAGEAETEECKELAFDEMRDAELFVQILKTLRYVR